MVHTLQERAFKPLQPQQDEWTNWRWQQTNAVRNMQGLRRWFPELDDESSSRIEENMKFVRFQATPYLLSLVKRDGRNAPLKDDPIWRTYFPTYSPPKSTQTLGNVLADNWELPEDMINPILQHKYESRVGLRMQNRCLAYCGYCFEAKRVLDPHSKVGQFRDSLFLDALNYISKRPFIHEVVLSGGEPLTMSNDKLGKILHSIRALPQVKAVRIQTRAFTQNPFRLDEGLINLLIKYKVVAIGMHIAHPSEITKDFDDVLRRFSMSGYRGLILGQIPLLKGINDSVDILEDLLMKLYSRSVKPYYFLHPMPETPGAESFRTSVRVGVNLMRNLRRRISNPALPEYVIVHKNGKHTVPMELDGTSEFQYVSDRLIRFRNWKGEWCEYIDAPS